MQIKDDIMDFLGMWNSAQFEQSVMEEGQIIISGMGGSGIGGQILSSVSDSYGFARISSWNNYNLPKWANKNCSVICVSYSGNTAETLSAAKDALELGCNLEVVTTGGKLKKLAELNSLSITEIEKGHQPRAALPLLLKALICRVGLPDIDQQIKEVGELTLPIDEARNIASQIKGTIPCIYSSNLMNPVAYRWRCQIQENAKQLAFNHQIPEMNHNEIVGWTLPNSQMSVILIRDSNDNEQIKNRFDATKNVAWNDMKVIECVTKGRTPLARIMSMIILGDLVSLELANLNDVDPTPVEVIENLKKELGGK